MSRLRVNRLLVVVVMLVLSACQVDVTIDLDVAENGSGTVTVVADFDDEASVAAGDLAGQLRVDDLRQAGWDVVIEETDGGSTRLMTARTVDDESQWQIVLDQIAGPGVFTDLQVTTVDEFAKRSQRLAFTLDLSDGWNLVADDTITEAFDGEAFGAPIETLTDGRPIDDIVSINVNAAVVSDASGSAAVGTYRPRFDSDEPLVIAVESTTEDSRAILLRWIAIALFSLFVLATLLAMTGVVLQRRSDRLRPTPTPASLASRVPAASAAKSETPAAAAQSPDESVRLVVIEPLAVLYQQAHPIDDHVLPFVRDQGGKARADTIVAGYQSLLAGATDTATFWKLCGLDGTAQEIDDRYLANRELRSAAADSHPGAVCLLC